MRCGHPSLFQQQILKDAIYGIKALFKSCYTYSDDNRIQRCKEKEKIIFLDVSPPSFPILGL